MLILEQGQLEDPTGWLVDPLPLEVDSNDEEEDGAQSEDAPHAAHTWP